ncbi:MAG: hypothetical protein BWY94_01703 [Actinobacteria bacterium ADurb.BinA094]|nr:MAG: hypothetical protein BWY94_01703 [Actinobacteria bacterium ADurb.BinA094]
MRTLESLPAATRLPESVTAPTTTPAYPDTMLTVLSSDEARVSSTNDTSIDARPPIPFCSATIAGIWIMLTRSDTTQPTAAPIANAGPTTHHARTSLETSTKTIANAMATAPR